VQQFRVRSSTSRCARVAALGDVQEAYYDLHDDFREEKAALEAKYRALYQPLYNRRAAIVKGEDDVVGWCRMNR